MKSISSTHNALFKTWKNLLDSKGARKEGLCIVSGRKIVPELLEQFPELCQDILFDEAKYEQQSEELFYPESINGYLLTNPLFREIDESGTHYPILVMKLPFIEEDWEENSRPQGLEVAAGLGEPTNLGALVRSCEAFGVSKLILLKECVFPFHPKAIRASSGSVFRVKMVRGPSINELKGPLTVLDKGGENIKDYKWPKDVRLLMGEEGRGVPEALTKQTIVSIKMHGQVESLNAVAATSVALFHYNLSRE